MIGINLAESCHSVNALPPVSISGGKTSQAFSMKNAAHASIKINFGVRGAANPTAILLNACTDANGSNATAIGFWWYNQPGGAGNDVPSKPAARATASGITSFPSSVANYTYTIEVDAAELQQIVEGGAAEAAYLNVQITDSGNTTYANIDVTLSGLRQQFAASPSATV